MGNRVFNPAVLIPVFDHEEAIVPTVESILHYSYPVLLVDDGSGPRCEQVLQELAETHGGRISLMRLPRNGGKGAAVKAGLKALQRLGYTHALQFDADGQHDETDLSRFLAAAAKAPEAVVTGYPQYDDSVPKLRFYGRYLTHIWVWINTLSFAILDTMCGFRVYPVDRVIALVEREPMGDRMEFDTEVMVRWVWQRGPVINLPTQVRYPLDGVSHFAVWRDNWLISKMHAKLFFGMLWRMPKLLMRKLYGCDSKFL